MQIIGAFSALVTGKSTKTAYDCLTNCEMYVGNFERFKKLASVNIEISNLYYSLLELTFIRMESRIFELSVLDAKQRYLKLQKKVPQIEELIPQYHIASSLNVSAVQLSRIKKELQDS